jgi:DNA-binding YbaB/EbfC family protein
VAELDFANLVQQAQALQEKLKQVQEEAAAKVVEAEAGGGMVKVVADGSMRIRKVVLDPALIAANDQPMLEDLIVVAINHALDQAQRMLAEEMSKLGPLAGLKLPGFGQA